MSQSTITSIHDAQVEHVVMDIEGTTTSISFVSDVLFPFVLQRLEHYLQTTLARDDPQTRKDIDALRDQAMQDVSGGDDGRYRDAPSVPEWDTATIDEIVDAVVRNVTWNMSLDRKMTALKQLQGHMWLEGYESGELKGHLYEDVPRAFTRWRQMGKRLYIYSSGSVQAQKLLFKHSVAGDLTAELDGHYDTVFPGTKVSAESYHKIAEDIANKTASSSSSSSSAEVASKIMFLTDNILEAYAAREAGYGSVVLSVREGTQPLPKEHDFPVITTFDMLFK